jgi:hypothetical protein
MKKVKLNIPVFVLFLSLFSNLAFSQWEEGQISVHLSIPEIALVDIEPGANNSIDFSIIPSAESGNSSIAYESSNESLWINYSSALANQQNTRKIVAEISQGVLPKGILLYLQASHYSGSGEGKLGHSSGKIKLANQPKPIITNIGSCYTGDGINNGHLLTFSIEIKNYSKVYATEESDFNILYTITDN